MGSRQISELGREDGAYERSGAGDGGEMMSEDDPSVGGLVIVPVAERLRGGGAFVVQPHHFDGDELRIEAVGHQIGTHGGHEQPEAVDVIAAVQSDGSQA